MIAVSLLTELALIGTHLGAFLFGALVVFCIGMKFGLD